MKRYYLSNKNGRKNKLFVTSGIATHAVHLHLYRWLKASWIFLAWYYGDVLQKSPQHSWPTRMLLLNALIHSHTHLLHIPHRSSWTILTVWSTVYTATFVFPPTATRVSFQLGRRRAYTHAMRNAQVCLHYVIEYRLGLTTRLWLGMKQTEEVGHRSIGNTTKSVCV